MKSYWNQKVVLVTGGSSGLGYELATAFVREGARVVVAALEPEMVEKTVEMLSDEGEKSGSGGSCMGFAVDVTQEKSVEQLVENIRITFGRLDALINVAGRTDRGKLASCSAEHFASVMELNFIALVRVTQKFLPMLLESRGHVVNIGSLASMAASRWTGAYPASKHAVAAYSQQLRLELGAEGLKVLLVCPGPIHRETERLYPLEGLEDLPESARRPGAGVKVRKLRPEVLVKAILDAAKRGKRELILPWKARILFTICRISPALGDWLIMKNT
ncbi:MAG: SDR family oxidoreductase [Planctomycetia bacterium]|nr:SDR family oxidoreductase [Planctomycetia bacterium]